MSEALSRKMELELEELRGRQAALAGRVAADNPHGRTVPERDLDENVRDLRNAWAAGWQIGFKQRCER